MSAADSPRRIVCLTEEPTEILYLLGEEDRIVGISASTCRPPRAREEKPVVSAFVQGNVKRIRELDPDLVIGFSDVQAQLAHDLVRAGLSVLIFNQRSLEEILSVILTVGRLVGAEEKARELVDGYHEGLESRRQRVAALSDKPRVYFEEWDDPMLCGIHWVSELVELAGGIDIFADRARSAKAEGRVVRGEDVLERRPDIILASWCGKPFDERALRSRPGWGELPAVANDRIHEINASIILQPGPASLTDGLAELERLIDQMA